MLADPLPLAPFTATPYGAVMRGVRGGSGPAALLLHGTAGSWRNFRDWLPVLLPRAALLIPDLPGCGDSPAPPVRPRLHTWARLLHAATEELATPPRILVGLGLGASLALAYLAVAPPAARAALTHVILHTPTYCPEVVQPLFRWGVPLLGAAPVFAVLQQALRHPTVRAWCVNRAVGGPDVAAEDLRFLRADLQRASLPVLRGLARDMVRADFRPLLAGLDTPLLAIVAEHDPFVDAATVARLTTRAPAGRVLLQRQVGHGWTPAAVAEQRRVLTAFLDS